MNAASVAAWPVLRRYSGAQLRRIAMPLGGIGTGTVSLGGRGDLRDWEVVNRPAKGFVPRQAFFALHVRRAGGEAVTRLLEGPLDSSLYEGARGSSAPNHSLPRFQGCTFEAAYPLGQVLLTDPGVPLDVRLQAFNPLIPADADRSGIPVAVLRFVLANRGDATWIVATTSAQNAGTIELASGEPVMAMGRLHGQRPGTDPRPAPDL